MRFFTGMVLAAWLATSGPTARAAASCQLGKLVEFPVTMMDLKPLMTAQINGVPVQFIIDSGAFFSMISPASAAELHLPSSPAPFGMYVTGVAGSADVRIANASTFTLAGIPLHDVKFLEGGSEMGSGSVGLLGQNVLHLADVEYDLAQGVVRLMKPKDCGNRTLAYWVPGGGNYSVMDIQHTEPDRHTKGVAYVNGARIVVEFDTGAGPSMLSLPAAARVGIKPDSPGVVYAGMTHGIGSHMIPSYIAPVASFKIGDEEIQHTKLRIADMRIDVDMLIGPDFFLSHRIYVANSQHKLYFTYNGGPVFDLRTAPAIRADAGSASLPPVADTTAEPATQPDASPADLARRGAALAARRQFDQAIAALTRACELAPTEAAYFYERARAYAESGQTALARADLDKALELKPDEVDARLMRAELLLRSPERDAAARDLDQLDGEMPKESDARFTLASAYERLERYDSAVAEWSDWIGFHEADARLAQAMVSRCWSRAALGNDLSLAVKDCDWAVHHASHGSVPAAVALRTRGFVFLRMGDYGKSLRDYDESLKITPKNAAALYGRAIDERRLNKTTESKADIAQAQSLNAHIVEEFERRGVTP